MKRCFQCGMTLAEMLIATSIGTLVIALTMESFINLYRSIDAANAYRNVHEDARASLAWINKDVRASTGVVSWVSNDITLAAMNSTGGVANIRYKLSGSQLLRTYTLGSVSSNRLTANLTFVTFDLYNKAGGLTTTLTNAYEVRAYLQISNTASYRIVSDLLQTRVRMRNKP